MQSQGTTRTDRNGWIHSTDTLQDLISQFLVPDPMEVPKQVNDSVVLPFWMARLVALDLVEKERLEARELVYQLELVQYQELATSLQEINLQKDLQLELLQKQQQLLEIQLQSEQLRNSRASPDKTVIWLLRMLAAVGVGWVLGISSS